MPKLCADVEEVFFAIECIICPGCVQAGESGASVD